MSLKTALQMGTCRMESGTDFRWRLWFLTSSAHVISPGGAAPADERGRPFILAPDGTYDIDLNEFFLSVQMQFRSPHTLEAYARDLCGFLSFVSAYRSSTRAEIWRNVGRDDRRSYAFWRNESPEGPRVSGSTWNRGVAAVSQFYQWASEEGHVLQSPITTRAGRPAYGRSRGGPRSLESRPDAVRERIQWLDGPAYRRWRDVGIRGYSKDGLRDSTSRRSLAGRDAAFTDLMVRTGLRLTEQSSLLLTDLPRRDEGTFVVGMLPNSIAKNGSGRKIYYPTRVLAQLEAYIRVEDRKSVV